jgi:hypothetical protein
MQNFIRVFYEQAGSEKKYDIRFHGAVMAAVIAAASSDLRHLKQPSIFKKASLFTLHFLLNNPIAVELPDGWYPEEVSHLNAQNAILVFEICRQSLHGAIIHGTDGEDKILKIKITPSKHQLVDIIKSFATIPPVPAAYDAFSRLLALLYESLAYEFNPTCRYKPLPPSASLGNSAAAPA